MQRFKSPVSARRFWSIHAAVQNTFSVQRHLTTRHSLLFLRKEAFQTWRAATPLEPELSFPIFFRPDSVRVMVWARPRGNWLNEEPCQNGCR